MNVNTAHLWIVGDTRRDRFAALAATAGGPRPWTRVSSHRSTRGPYAGTAALLTRIVPQVKAADPALVRAHDVELLSAAPDLEQIVEPSRQTLTSLAIPEERTRFYGPGRTRRLAHGLAEFLMTWARRAADETGQPLAVFFDQVHEADGTEQEMLAILLRRADPAHLRVAVGTDGAALPDRAAELSAALERYAVRLDAPPAGEPDPAEARDRADVLAAAFVAADGAGDCPAERLAYDRLTARRRAALHDERADELERRGPQEFRLGAIPYHRARGSDPAGAGLRALLTATGTCVDMGFYHAVLDLGFQARELADPAADENAYCAVSTKLTTALAVLGRADEAEAVYFDLRGRFTTPMVHLFSNYAMGMLHTRHRTPARRDHAAARVHLNTAIAIASLMPDASRSFQRVFQQNGLALVEMHTGNLPEAERLVTEGLAELDAELAEGEHQLHRSVLLHNRAQVRAALGRLDEALADFSAVIAADPNHPEYYFDRASLLRRTGDTDAALADYQRAIDISPPFPEAYYNRGDLRSELGDAAGAAEDFGYVLELEPDYADARVNRAALRLEAGDLDGALADVAEGLEHHPDNADLLCTRGLIALEQDDAERARQDFTAALALDPDHYQALANRAVIAQDAGRHEDALADLGRALDLTGPDGALLYNRGFVHRAAGHWAQAEADFTAALGLPDADADELLWERAGCRELAGDHGGARSDLAECARLSAGPFAPRAAARLADLARS